MKRNILRLGAVAALAVTLAGCGANISEGTVLDKQHSPSHTQVTTICMPNPSTGGCSPTVSTTYIPERWSLVIDPPSGEAGSVSVSSGEWSSVQIGDYWTRQH